MVSAGRILSREPCPLLTTAEPASSLPDACCGENGRHARRCRTRYEKMCCCVEGCTVLYCRVGTPLCTILYRYQSAFPRGRASVIIVALAEYRQ